MGKFLIGNFSPFFEKETTCWGTKSYELGTGGEHCNGKSFNEKFSTVFRRENNMMDYEKFPIMLSSPFQNY